MGRSRKGDMVSSKDQAKKISQDFRQLSKKFFEDFYAKAEVAGRHPLPLESMGQLCRTITAATEGEWPPQPSHPDQPGVQPGVSAEVFEAFLDPRLFQQVYLEAVSA